MKDSIQNNNNNNKHDETFHFKLNDEEIDEIAKHVQRLDDEDTPLASLRSVVSKTETCIQQLRDTEKDVGDRLVQIEQHIKNLTNKQQSSTPPNSNNTSSIGASSKPKFVPAENETLDHDVVIIGDSNTKHIDMRTLGRGTSRKRFTCYTIPQAITFINTANIIKQPKKVVLHLGTNHAKFADCNPEQLQIEFDGLIALTRRRFPSARIYLSSVFCRMKESDKRNETIKVVNTYLSEFCDKSPNFTLVNNSNIHHKDMKDHLHLNPTGFHTFVSNLGVTVFGEKHSSSQW